MSKTYVAIGCSTARDYSFLIPLTCLFWRDVIGHTPITFLVGTKETWRSQANTKAVLDALVHHDIQHHFVNVEGYSEGTIAQNVRHHAAALTSIADEDWVILADADLWPLRRAFYHFHEQFDGKAMCLYSNGDHFAGRDDVLSKFDAGGGFQSIPTCHVIMRAKEWRSVYDIIPGDVVGSVKRTFANMEPWLARCTDQNLARWCCDQWYVTERLCRQPWFPAAPVVPPCPPGGRAIESEHVVMIERYGHPPLDRLDRYRPTWGAFNPEKWTDAHVHKSPETPEHWADELAIITSLMPQHETWAQQYREEYVR